MHALFLGGRTFDRGYRLDLLSAASIRARADPVNAAAGGPARNTAVTCAIAGEAARAGSSNVAQYGPCAGVQAAR